MDDKITIDQLRTLAKMTAGGLSAGGGDSSLDQLARAGLFVVHCYSMKLLAEAEKAEAEEGPKAK